MPGKGRKKKQATGGSAAASGNTPKSKKENRVNSSATAPVVGIGASAGGLETLETFFSRMPPDTDLAFVVIQHLSPQHKSVMASLLAKHTRMPVQQIENDIALEPGHIYLNPPDKNVAVFNRRLHLLEPVPTGGINMPIDFFFRSLSEDQGENAICIILSGTASDGTLGLKAVKGAGGMAMVQDPDTAKYGGMPRSAIGSGLVDFILPVEKMPEKLIRYATHPFLDVPGKIKTKETIDQQALRTIFLLIRRETGHDFSQYKQKTIGRRIERRLAIHQINTIADYIRYLQKNPREIKLLFKDLVIGVTSFFRDPEAFAMLEQEVLPELLRKKVPDTPVRIWVAGCSTGEEAYSLAMAMFEAMTITGKSFSAQIFATDIDETAIEIARRGVYPGSIATDVPPERLDRFFTKFDGGFKVKKLLRDMVVFSLQSVIKDPPFSRLDLVSCRNLMIYMEAAIQKKILPMFHYTLTPDGILFLGTSESIGGFTDLFQAINSKWKLFKRSPGASALAPPTPRKIDSGVPQFFEFDENKKMPPPLEIQTIAEQAILDEYAPSGVLVDEKYEILHFIGKTGKYLVPPMGKPNFNILNMAREDIKPNLMVTLQKALRKKEAAAGSIQIHHHGIVVTVNVTVKPLADRGLPGLMLVMFKDEMPEALPEEKTAAATGTEKSPEVQQLEQELRSTREYLQATIEELETSNEELRSTNEEMQSVNEELQSTNEELETSKEELQSTNEELATVNSELQDKVEELVHTSNDMNNLMASTQIASIFLDCDMRIKRYTPPAADIVKLIHTDIGRPLSDLKTSFPDVDLTGLAQRVLKDLNTIEMEILSTDPIWYTVKVLPYRTLDNIIDGVVMSFIDVHKIKQADKARRFATVLEDSNDAVTVVDSNGKILAWNQGAVRMYGWSETEALAMNVRQLIPEKKRDEVTVLFNRLMQGKTVKSFETQRLTKDGRPLDVWLTATALRDDAGNIIEVATTERDLAWITRTQGAT